MEGAYYLEWPAELIARAPDALARARHELADQVDLVQFAQFLVFRQGEALKRHAHSQGIRLIGDLPFFVSADFERRMGKPGTVPPGRSSQATVRRRSSTGLFQRGRTAMGQPRV